MRLMSFLKQLHKQGKLNETYRLFVSFLFWIRMKWLRTNWKENQIFNFSRCVTPWMQSAVYQEQRPANFNSATY